VFDKNCEICGQEAKIPWTYSSCSSLISRTMDTQRCEHHYFCSHKCFVIYIRKKYPDLNISGSTIFPKDIIA
jgi:hypothetical protein